MILFTGDGNGVGTNYAIRLFEGQLNGGTGDDFVQPHEAFPNSALVKTYTTNGQTPDCAPTASAMNTGVKSKNTMINVSDAVAVDDCANMAGNELTTFAEIVSDMGKSVGVISTARLTHATPAAVYAKTVNRNWEDNTFVPEGCTAQEDIAAQLIAAMKAGTVDFAMGGGRRHFIGDGRDRCRRQERQAHRRPQPCRGSAGNRRAICPDRGRVPRALDRRQQRPDPRPVRSRRT